jgi:SAM-dependent methyltransferase
VKAPKPYPVSVAHRDVLNEPVPPGAGVECFNTPGALAINKARMDHVASLGLDISGKTFLDVGCGVGHLAQRLIGLGARVTCTDGRAENIAHLKTIYPGVPADVADVETVPMDRFGQFDGVLCFGLLYHLADPVAGLQNISRACTGLLLLETLVCDSKEPVNVLVDEPKVANQALGMLASRPSPAFVAMTLNRIGFPFIYAPKIPPQHEDFRFEWRNDLSYARDGHPIRCVFVASRQSLDSNSALARLID